MKKIKKTFFVLLGIIWEWGVIPFLFYLFLQEGGRFHFIFPHSFLNFFLGIIFFFAGIFLTLSSFLTIHRKGKGTILPSFPTTKLIVNGIYEFCRNPMYLGYSFLFVSFAFLLKNIYFFFVSFGVYLFIYVYSKIYEEKSLIKRFGDEYKTYKKNISFLLPIKKSFYIKKPFYSFFLLLFLIQIIYPFVLLRKNQKIIPDLISSLMFYNSSKLEILPQDKILILAPHPDDEVLACAGVIQRAVKMGIQTKIVFFTYGDNNEWSFFLYRKHPVISSKSVQKMGLIRYKEAISSCETLGVKPEDVIFLGYPDFKTFSIWLSHWAEEPPLKSMLTKTTYVPYENAFRPKALYKGEEIIYDLSKIIQQFQPTKIFLPSPVDYNSDHQSLYLFTEVCLLDLKEKINPNLYYYLVHYKRWPIPIAFDRKLPLLPPEELKNSILWKTFPLTPEEVNKKLFALKKHATQYKTNPKFFKSFIRKNELFGEIPILSINTGNIQNLFPGEPTENSKLPPEELLEYEKNRFIRIETFNLKAEDEKLIFTINFSKPLRKGVSSSLYLFGYSKNVPFNKMPKIHIQIGEKSINITDKNKKLNNNSINITNKRNQVIIDIPLKILNYPDKLFTSVRTNLKTIPLDYAPWRIIDLQLLTER